VGVNITKGATTSTAAKVTEMYTCKGSARLKPSKGGKKHPQRSTQHSSDDTCDYYYCGPSLEPGTLWYWTLTPFVEALGADIMEVPRGCNGIYTVHQVYGNGVGVSEPHLNSATVRLPKDQ
jgi:hypothetical protein